MYKRQEQAPEKFNPNVLLRPVVQDYLLPTLVYTGGAAEVAYFAQVAVVYEKLLGRITPILPRFSATLLEPKPERILARYQLSLPDLFLGPEKVREAIAARSLPSDLQTRFTEAYASVDQSMAALRESIGKLDSTLIDTAESLSLIHISVILMLALIAFWGSGRSHNRTKLRLSQLLVVLLAAYAGFYSSRNLPVSSMLLALIAGPILWENLVSLAYKPGAWQWVRNAADRVSKFSDRMGAQEMQFRGHLWPVVSVCLLYTSRCV